MPESITHTVARLYADTTGLDFPAARLEQIAALDDGTITNLAPVFDCFDAFETRSVVLRLLPALCDPTRALLYAFTQPVDACLRLIFQLRTVAQFLETRGTAPAPSFEEWCRRRVIVAARTDETEADRTLQWMADKLASILPLEEPSDELDELDEPEEPEESEESEEPSEEHDDPVQASGDDAESANASE